jgi:RNA polymerase sigma factor (sigma-70 family)
MRGGSIESTTTDLDTPDETLIERTRKGDKRAFGELWRRHYRSGVTVAHSFTSLDADDLVSEAFVRIYKRTLDGGGPHGAFRPYLYTTIRNLASTWGAASKKTVQVDAFDEIEPGESAEEPVARSLDRSLTVAAYQSLPVRWQTVLWYTEVEGLDPSEVAPILGMSANGVAALSYRAREGLRKAWLQAHVSDATASGACAWAVEHLGEHARKSLSTRESRRMTGHLAECAKCSSMCQEVEDIGSRLAMAMIPLLLGTVAAGTLLGSVTGGAAGSAAAAGIGAGVASTAVPALPAAIGATAVGAGATASVSTIFAVAASTVVVAAAGVGVVGFAQSSNSAAADEKPSSLSDEGAMKPLGSTTDVELEEGNGGSPVDPSDIPEVTVTSIPVDISTSTPADSDGGSGDTSGSTDETGTGTTTDTTDSSTPVDKTTDTADKGDEKVTDKVTDTTGKTGKKVKEVTDTVDSTVGKTVDTVKGTVDSVEGLTDGLTNTVDGVVDSVLPAGDGLTGTLNNKLDQTTGTVDSLTGNLNTTVDATLDDVDGLVGGLLGGVGKLLGG